MLCSKPVPQQSPAVGYSISSGGGDTFLCSSELCFGTQQPCLHQQAPAQRTTKPTAPQRGEVPLEARTGPFTLWNAAGSAECSMGRTSPMDSQKLKSRGHTFPAENPSTGYLLTPPQDSLDPCCGSSFTALPRHRAWNKGTVEQHRVFWLILEDLYL